MVTASAGVQTDLSKVVALFPSSNFIAKNQLARGGSQSVSPVTILALTTIMDRQLKEDQTLCLVWAEVLSNQGLERVSIPTSYFLQERTYLKHQTCYTLFLFKANYPTSLQISRSAVLGLGPS